MSLQGTGRTDTGSAACVLMRKPRCSATKTQLGPPPLLSAREPAACVTPLSEGAGNGTTLTATHGRFDRPAPIQGNVCGPQSGLDGTPAALPGEPCTARPDLAGAQRPTYSSFILSIPRGYATLLSQRARSAQVTKGRYVCSLLDEWPEPPLGPDHSAAVSALNLSTDRVAAMSTDLNAFLRMLERVPADQLEGYRAGLKSLVADMRSHLLQASALLADLTSAKRWRR